MGLPHACGCCLSAPKHDGIIQTIPLMEKGHAAGKGVSSAQGWVRDGVRGAGEHLIGSGMSSRKCPRKREGEVREGEISEGWWCEEESLQV